jgi:hypothetical protein
MYQTNGRMTPKAFQRLLEEKDCPYIINPSVRVRRRGTK